MECQVDKNEHFRHFLLFAFNQRSKVSKAAQDICAVYGEGAISERTAQKWFSRFAVGNFELSDYPRSGRPVQLEEKQLNDLIHEDPRQTTREPAQKMGCSHDTIARHLHSLGKVQKLGAWVPHVLDENHKLQRASISASLLTRHQATSGHKERFLYRIVAGDEKWCLYVNLKKRKEWLSPNKLATPRTKPELHPRKAMICVWWDCEGVIHYEMLEKNQTVNAELYIQQMWRLKEAIQRKRPNLMRHGVLLQHDNARPHISKLTKAAIQEIGWEILPHPPYSPDLAPTDFHLFRSLSNNLRDVSFNDNEELKMWLDNFLAPSPVIFTTAVLKNL